MGFAEIGATVCESSHLDGPASVIGGLSLKFAYWLASR